MHFSLKLVHPNVDATAENFSPPSFPPPPDFPISFGRDGKVLSRYRDDKWDLTPMSRKITLLYFRDRSSDPRRIMDETNGALLRVLMSYWLWGPMAVVTTAEMVTRFGLLRPLFALCSDSGISADRLNRHPKVLSRLQDSIPRSQSRNIVRLLHDVFEARHDLGFFLLTREQIVALSAQLPDHQKTQTPYIPPRIWSYVMHRTLSVIDEFLAISDEYAAHFNGLLEISLGPSVAATDHPTPSPAFAAFTQKWISGDSGLKNCVSNIASLVSLCASVQLISYSLMRIEEASSLPLNCLSITQDAVGETIYTVQGNSTKTLMDEDARWIVSSDCVRVLRAVSIVARLRLSCRSRLLDTGDKIEDDAPLFPRAYEPWQTSKGLHYWNIRIVKDPQELHRTLDRFSKVLSPQEMIINEADMSVCRHLNPKAPATRIAIGLPWRMAWHQLRRTGAVNMLSSGLVSDLSLQYQLKHTGLSMSRYYGRGHLLLGSTLNDGARGEYVRNMYEILAREFSNLQSERFVSPYGEAHKNRILNIVSGREHSELTRAAKSGKLKYRSHLLGGCASPTSCNLGGFENVAACSLPKPCEYLIYDAARMSKYRTLLADVRRRLEVANVDSPLHEALSGQAAALEQGLRYCEASRYAEES